MTRAAAHSEDLDEKRRRFLAAAQDIPRRGAVAARSLERGLSARALREFGLSHVDVVLSRLGLRAPRRAEIPLFWGRTIRLAFNPDDDFAIFYLTGAPGGPEYKLVRYLIKTLGAADVFYDVGAGYGFYTHLAAEFAAEVHAFEPWPEGCRGILENRAGPEVVNELALSDRTGETFLHVHPLSASMSTVEPDVAAADPRFAGARRIAVRGATLDEYAAAHRAPTILKIDAEGAEGRIVDGGRGFFAAHAPVVAMEVWGGEGGRRFSLPVARKMRALGYRPRILEEDGAASGPLSDAQFELYLSGISWDNVVFAKD